MQEVMAQMLKTTNYTGQGNAYGTLKPKNSNKGNGFGEIMRSMHQNSQKTWAKEKPSSEVKQPKKSTIQTSDEVQPDNQEPSQVQSQDADQVQSQSQTQTQPQIQSDSTAKADAGEETDQEETIETQDSSNTGKVDAAALMLALTAANQQISENTESAQETETASVAAVDAETMPAIVQAGSKSDASVSDSISTSVPASTTAAETSVAADTAADTAAASIQIQQTAVEDTDEQAPEKTASTDTDPGAAVFLTAQTNSTSAGDSNGQTTTASLQVQVAGEVTADADTTDKKGSESGKSNRTGAASKSKAEETSAVKAGYVEQTAVDSAADEDKGQKTKNTDVKNLITMETDRYRGTQSKENVQADNSGQAEVTVRTDASVEMLKTKDTSQLKNQVISTKVETKEIVDQIVNKFELVSKGGSSTVTIELKPEFLGKLHIKISMEDGVLTAKFHTDNQQVKHMLEGGIGQLKSALEGNGIRLEKAEVNVDLNNSGSSQGFNQPDYQNPDRQKEARTYWLEQISKPEAEYEVVSAEYAKNLDGAVNYVI